MIDKELIRNLYDKHKSISEVGRLTGYHYRTIRKQIIDMLPKEIPDYRIVNTYLACGSLERTSKIVSLNKTSVWRRLKKNKIIVGRGTKSWKSLYSTLRRRITTSKWRDDILKRDNYKCVKCKQDSNIVHHIIKLSDIRDKILTEYPELNPFESYRKLREFTDLVLLEHNKIEGIVLCRACHDSEHSKKLFI